MRIKRKSKPVIFSAKLIIFYIVIIFIVLMIYKNFVGPLGNREIKLVKQIKQTLAIPEYNYRHSKDKETLQRIKIYKRRHPRKVKGTKVMPKVGTTK